MKQRPTSNNKISLKELSERDGIWSAIESVITDTDILSFLIDNLEEKRYGMDKHAKDRKMLEAIDTQMESIVEFLNQKNKDPKEVELASKQAKELPNLRRTKKDLMEIIGIISEEATKENDISLSTLDRIMENKMG